MNYRPVNELISATARDTDGQSTSRYIHHESKKNQWGKLNYLITGEVRKNDLVTRWKDYDSHTVNDAFNYCPMLLNYLTLKGYRKVLFVGHFNAAQESWTFPRKSDRYLHDTPTTKFTSNTVVDPNIWVQFLPIVKMAYGYDQFEMHTCKPPESRHTQLMHSLYRRYEIDLVTVNKQYKHGREVTVTPPPDTQYDCVVFGGVPKEYEETRFSHHNIRGAFAHCCTTDFDIVDLNYQAIDEDKYIDGVQEDNREFLTEVFVSRTIWDERFRAESEADKSIEYAIVDSMVRTYSTP